MHLQILLFGRDYYLRRWKYYLSGWDCKECKYEKWQIGCKKYWSTAAHRGAMHLKILFFWRKYQLDQVYWAWLIKWIIKGEIIQLCLTKWWIISDTSRYWVSIRQNWLVLGGTGSVQTGTAWYYVVQGQHRAFMPVYIGNIYWIWSGVTDDTENRIKSYSACLKFKV